MKNSILKTSTTLLLLATYVYAATTNANETITNETRGPRVTGRIVKLYSGSKPEPIVCHGEGFQSDPNNCAVFYRCVSSSYGKFTVFRYQCGPGTIYDPETEICNHPKSTRRTECINFEARQNAINTEIPSENDIDFAGTVEVPNPIRTVKPIYLEHTSVKRYDVTVSTKSPWIVSTQTRSTSTKWLRPTPAISQKSSPQNGDTCISDGFMGDNENCRKFYRCVGNGRGGFIRYEFSCSESTMWDDEVQSCNHPTSVKRRRCGRGSDDQRDDAKESEKIVPKTYLPALPSTLKSTDSEAQTIQQQSQTNYGSKITQLQIQINNGSNNIQNQTQLNYGDRVNQSQKQENYGSYSKQNQNQTSYGSAYSQTQSQVNHDDNVVQTQLQINHSKQSSQSQTQTSKSNSSDSISTTSSNQEQSTETQPGSQTNKCSSSGFMGDAKNCKKFYRCVENGNGGYTQYEFSCGEGTVWDQNIEACNHPWAVNRCGYGPVAQSQESTTEESSTVITTTTQRTMQSTQQATTKDEDDVGYGNQNQNQESSSTSSSSQSTSTTTTQESTAAQTTITEGHIAKPACDHDGFIGDENDCKKFYRCVGNGNGGYTKYEYSCGEGTVWDPQITACNHAWAVEKCGGIAIDYNKETTTSKVSQETSTTTTTTEQPTTESEDGDTGYEQTESTSSSTTNAPPPSQESSNVCQSSGFMGDSNDCNKFYRCVDNGNGGYTKYEFSCGEGTVWDQSIEACNHAWAVKDCKSETPQTQTEAVLQHTSSTQTASSEPDDNDQTSTSSSSSRPDATTSKSDPEPSEGCTTEGFIGDETDCTKFYRCVDNGQVFKKYEFTCGDGTVWDSEIQTCNHPSRDNQCGNSQSSSSSTTREPDRENDEMYTEITSKTTTTTTTSQILSSEQPQSSSGICQLDGFYANPDDCKKFYRCVDDGKGGYTKYDFVCGDGTIWDQEIQGCNHDKGNKHCKQSSSSSSDSTIQTTQAGSTEYNSVVTASGTTVKTSTTESSVNKGVCTSDGFYANPNDCKTFYRCVDNGKGGFTKYDFSCGDGTIWVQEIQACDHDNEVNSCSTQGSATTSSEQHQTESTDQQPTSSSTSTTTTTQQQMQADEYPEESPSSSSSSNGQCTSEGFYPDEKDCRNFYRCVDNGNGGYTKYDFTCGDGTAWDSDIQACNHIGVVKSCDGSESTQEKPQSQESSSQPTMQDEQPGPTESSTSSTTSTTTTSTSGPCNDSSSESSSSSNPDQCTQEGYYGNSQDCKKFYRCVDNGNRGYTKYDFDCGEGTIWDQDITACNHPRDVKNPSCQNGQEPSSLSESSSTESNTESSSSQSTQSTSSQNATSSTTEKNNNQNSSDCNNSSQKPERSEVNCTKAGFYADPDDCKKFYRCVDWDGSGEKFSVFHFECGEGTIWDPAVDTCNHEDSVYPSRDCSGSQSQAGETNETTTTTTTTTESSSTTAQQSSTTTNHTTTTEDASKETTTQPTTQESTTSEETTTQQSTTSEKTTTQQSTTSEQTTTQQSTTSEQTTTQQLTTEQLTTSEQTTTQSTTEKTTTQESTTSEQTTTQQSTTSQQTTQESTTGEQTTQESTTSEQTSTPESTTNEQTTQQSTTSQQTTEESTTSEQTTTEESTTEGTTQHAGEQTTQQSTTQESTTTESTTESSSEKECPETEDDQYLYVCPTGFRRHPKYCDMFYQCTEDDDTHEVKVANFNCPNNTIYDENKTQCVEEDKAEKKCDGQKAQKKRFKRLNVRAGDQSPMMVSTQKHNCPAPGHYPFEKQDECSSAFLKCEKTKSGKIRGFVYKCPNQYVYWSVSRRCEPKGKLRNCKDSVNNWSGRWEIPVETKNVAPPLIDERWKDK